MVLRTVVQASGVSAVFINQLSVWQLISSLMQLFCPQPVESYYHQWRSGWELLYIRHYYKIPTRHDKHLQEHRKATHSKILIARVRNISEAILSDLNNDSV